ncbi:hypothetical protein ZHAS_00008367 [Anopheles sinensis]|uniref:Uncharacterized protein n=1 Tax=Anopheles sinensis TaxID=74873 RepID=A0A084VSA1_ANOSI|nr:hypothetical protein ZHAS_00008367 [Anopheles sinensis]
MHMLLLLNARANSLHQQKMSPTKDVAGRSCSKNKVLCFVRVSGDAPGRKAKAGVDENALEG